MATKKKAVPQAEPVNLNAEIITQIAVADKGIRYARDTEFNGAQCYIITAEARAMALAIFAQYQAMLEE